MPLAVWADVFDVPNKVCVNARLLGATLPTLTDQTYGQGGWDVGLRFLNVIDLADQLSQLAAQPPPHMCAQPSSGYWGRRQQPCPSVGPITRLAIMAHGEPGAILIGGRDGKWAERWGLSTSTIPFWWIYLQRIYNATETGSIIYLMGCNAGEGNAGTDLLKRLSQIWPDRRVVAFTTVGYDAAEYMKRTGEDCTEPGMRDTWQLSSPLGPAAEVEAAKEWRENWKKLNVYPWADENSPGAKVAMNGQIIREPFIDE